MQLTTFLLVLFGIVTSTRAQDEGPLKNSTQEFHLHTSLKPGQSGKSRFDNLYIEAWHTGAGLDDAVVVENKTYSPPAFLNGTRGQSNGVKYQDLIFDQGGGFPYLMLPEPYDVPYSAWQPIRINAAIEPSDIVGGFFINSTGLQWTTNVNGTEGSPDVFGGWLVCDWWHGVPQLFFRYSYYSVKDYPAPCSCAEVWLCPQYI